MLKAKYKAVHFIGVLICLGGIGLMVWADFTSCSQGPQPGTVLPAVLSVFRKFPEKWGKEGSVFVTYYSIFSKVLCPALCSGPSPPISIEESHMQIYSESIGVKVFAICKLSSMHVSECSAGFGTRILRNMIFLTHRPWAIARSTRKTLLY